MSNAPSSFTKFQEFEAEVREAFPYALDIQSEDRQRLFAVLHKHCAQFDIHEYPKQDGTIFQIDLTGNSTDCHYPAVFLNILQSKERAKSIHPSETRLWEVSTGSAGIACQRIAHLLGYKTGLLIPELEEVRTQALCEMSQQYPDCHSVEIMPDAEHFLLRSVTEFRSRLGRGINTRTIPNHANVNTSPEAIESIMKPIFEKMHQRGTQLDAIVLGMGNGTSIVGTMDALQEVYKDRPVQLHCFEGKFDPNLHQEMHGDLPVDQREDRVTMYGVDGTRSLRTIFRFPSDVVHNYQPVSHVVSREEWQQLHREHNEGLTGPQTHGRSSLAALGIASELPGNVAVLRYDHYDGRYDPLSIQDV